MTKNSYSIHSSDNEFWVSKSIFEDALRSVGIKHVILLRDSTFTIKYFECKKGLEWFNKNTNVSGVYTHDHNRVVELSIELNEEIRKKLEQNRATTNDNSK